MGRELSYGMDAHDYTLISERTARMIGSMAMWTMLCGQAIWMRGFMYRGR